MTEMRRQLWIGWLALAGSLLAGPSVARAETLSGPGCIPDVVQFEGYLRGDGSLSSSRSSNYGELYRLESFNGVVYHEIVAPHDFKPLTATDRELAVFGFPPRPESGPMRAAWLNEMAHWAGSAPPGGCTETVVHSHALEPAYPPASQATARIPQRSNRQR